MNFTELYMLNEAAETLASDVNEILVGYYALGGTWTGFQDSKDAKSQLDSRLKQIGEESYKIQDERAMVMADEIKKWAKDNGFKGKIVKAWWTARPGVLSKAVGIPVDSRKNPTDTLLQFSDGKFLGISAKSSKGSTEITFKNPGIGTLDRDLKLSNASMIKDMEQKVIDKLGLPASAKDRKTFIRSNDDIRDKTIAAGLEILKSVRDATLKKMNSMDQEELRQYLLTAWMDAGDENYPPYIKVTGRFGGDQKAAVADIVDPQQNPKIDAIVALPIKVEAKGSDSLGITAKGKRICAGRFKYESEKIASTIKMEVSGWK